MTAIAPGLFSPAAGTGEHTPLPETVQITAATIKTWREAGYRVSEQRVANWLYLDARSSWESALYKLVGPCFSRQTAFYEAWRIA